MSLQGKLLERPLRNWSDRTVLANLPSLHSQTRHFLSLPMKHLLPVISAGATPPPHPSPLTTLPPSPTTPLQPMNARPGWLPSEIASCIALHRPPPPLPSLSRTLSDPNSEHGSYLLIIKNGSHGTTTVPGLIRNIMSTVTFDIKTVIICHHHSKSHIRREGRRDRGGRGNRERRNTLRGGEGEGIFWVPGRGARRIWQFGKGYF